MIQHQQAPSQAVDISGLNYDFSGRTVTLTGSVTLFGVTHAVNEAIAFEDGAPEAWTVLITADGVVTTDATTDALAHLCWFDGVDLNVIVHSAPES